MSTNLDDETNESQADSRQVVALHLGGEVYGIDIATIHTVIMPQEITPVPKTAPYIRGVMNLRGRIVPVVDLRIRFDLGSAASDDHPGKRIVVVDTEGLVAGLIVDSVSEVLTLPKESVGPPSGLISPKDGEFLTGIGRVTRADAVNGKSEQLILLLDVVKVLTAPPLESAPKKRTKKAA